MKNHQRMYNNTILLKAVEEVDKDIAIEVISNPNLNGSELSEVLECSMLGLIVNKETKEPVKLSNDIIIAGLLNKLNQINNDGK